MVEITHVHSLCTRIGNCPNYQSLMTVITSLLSFFFLFSNSHPLGQIHLNDIVSMIDKPSLLKLKNEHGGLQTLLRNNCQIFEGTVLAK